MREQLQTLAMKIVDLVFAVIPQSTPCMDKLLGCKIISHRGEHDNITVFENTLPAFNKARDSGVWGVELDIRWTQDLVPVVSHDACGMRLFGRDEKIRELSAAQLRVIMPEVPTLAEVVSHYGGKVHLMIEIKDEAYPQLVQQKRVLSEQLEGLVAGQDYHFLGLDPSLYDKVDFVDRKFFFPVSELNRAGLSKAVIDGGFGGLTGHFWLLNKRLQRRHEGVGQTIGTGFISSRNCLFRELNRGVQWIFSNDAVKLQQILRQCQQ
jgi:glycerophosphoryl diester phosphodiesterase